MADSIPNYKLEQQRLRAQRQAQLANIERQKLDILEMADRRRRHEENIAASLRAIEEIDQQLAGLARTHGALTDQDFTNAVRSLSEEYPTDG